MIFHIRGQGIPPYPQPQPDPPPEPDPVFLVPDGKGERMVKPKLQGTSNERT